MGQMASIQKRQVGRGRISHALSDGVKQIYALSIFFFDHTIILFKTIFGRFGLNLKMQASPVNVQPGFDINFRVFVSLF